MGANWVQPYNVAVPSAHSSRSHVFWTVQIRTHSLLFLSLFKILIVQNTFERLGCAKGTSRPVGFWTARMCGRIPRVLYPICTQKLVVKLHIYLSVSMFAATTVVLLRVGRPHGQFVRSLRLFILEA